MREGKKLPSYWEKFKRGKRERKKNRGKIKTERFKLDYLYTTLFYILQLLFFYYFFFCSGFILVFIRATLMIVRSNQESHCLTLKYMGSNEIKKNRGTGGAEVD